MAATYCKFGVAVTLYRARIHVTRTYTIPNMGMEGDNVTRPRTLDTTCPARHAQAAACLTMPSRALLPYIPSPPVNG